MIDISTALKFFPSPDTECGAQRPEPEPAESVPSPKSTAAALGEHDLQTAAALVEHDPHKAAALVEHDPQMEKEDNQDAPAQESDWKTRNGQRLDSLSKHIPNGAADQSR